MKPSNQKGILDSMPRDLNRQSVLKVLRESKAPVKTLDLVDMARATTPECNIDARSAAEVVKSAVREGLIDVAGDGAEMRVQLTSFGSEVAKTID